jgi:hypothetical protein
MNAPIWMLDNPCNQRRVLGHGVQPSHGPSRLTSFSTLDTATDGVMTIYMQTGEHLISIPMVT